jgi:hypothetical protein
LSTATEFGPEVVVGSAYSVNWFEERGPIDVIRDGLTVVILGVLALVLRLVLGLVLEAPLSQSGAPGFEPPIVHWMTFGRNWRTRLLVSILATLPLRYSVNHATFLVESHVMAVAFDADVGMLISAAVAVEFLIMVIRFALSFMLVKIAFPCGSSVMPIG